MMLNMTKVELELISDACMYFFKERYEGGVSYFSKIYSKAKKKYFISYKPKQESKHIIYLESNNLYNYVMSKFLPTDRFKWIDPQEFDLNKCNGNTSKDYVLEADFEYRKKLREVRNDILYP